MDEPRSHAQPGKAPWKTGLLAATVVLSSLAAAPYGHAQGPNAALGSGARSSARDDVRMVAPALERYEQGALFGNLWRRPDLSPRDRSLVTLAALVARNQTAELPRYLNLALDSGVKPGEISEVVTHLAFYSGWPTASSAVVIARKVFAEAAR